VEGGESIPVIDPEQYAALVRDATDDQLAEGMRLNRELILSEVFHRMGDHFDAGRAGKVDAVIEWRITEAAGGDHDRWQMVIENGTCTVCRDGERRPNVTYTVGPVDFIRLISGNKSGPELFMLGKLKVRGNLMLAARMPGWFRIPGAR
jgi:putative sterol carrier protein